MATLALPSGAVPADAAPLRIATYNVGLKRGGPGLLLRDLLQGKAADAVRAAGRIREARPDVLLLTGFDYDAGGLALGAFADLIGEGAYPFRFALRPNTGRASGLDLDGDGRTGGPRDAQGYGEFAGQGGMAILSRLPLDGDTVIDLSELLWRDLPGARLPVRPDGGPFPSAGAQAVQRLSTAGHWVVPVVLPDGGSIDLLAFHATPPAFDGPERRNRKRAADEVRLWSVFLDGALDEKPRAGPFVILGTANIDPEAGDGDGEVMAAFLADPRLGDPVPRDAAGGTATADFPPPLGPLRVDYVLPSAGMRVADTGVAAATPEGPVHRLVWVDLALD